MKHLLIYAILAIWTFSCYADQCDITYGKKTVVNAADYEAKFHDIFQRYWFNNRTISSELRNVVKIPDQPNLVLEDLPDCLSPSTCLTCRAFSFSVLNYYRSHSSLDLDEYLYDLCTIQVKVSSHACHGLINIYGPSIKYILKHRANETSPDRICGILYQNRACSPNKYLIDFEIKSDREPVLKTPKTYEFNEKALNSSAFLTIAHLSDFHYDPFYAVGSSSVCVDSMCCRNSSIAKANSTHKAGYWGDYNVCDSPGYLVENICSQAATHKNIELIYYTGDFGDHFNWLSTKADIKHSIEFSTQLIKEKFPNVPVVMVMGNHDISPSDAFAPDSTCDTVNSKWVYEIAADLWSDWLPQSALSTLRIGGYYTFVFRPGFRIIVLNNNLCFTSNIWLLYDAKEMIAQLEWLRDTLIAAEMARERVHILGHVPPNTSSCIRVWNREYNKLVRQFAHIISGQFNGHTHSDEFTLYYTTSDIAAPVNVAWNGGSGTSFIGLNSNYRIYAAELNMFEIVDHETYIFNLTEANLAPGQPPRWFKEYSLREFLGAFGIIDLSPASLSKLVTNTFQHDRRALYQFWTFHSKSADPKLKEGCDDVCLEKFRQTLNGDVENTFF